MSIEKLKKKFLVDDDVVKGRLESLLTKALLHCVVDKKGIVHIDDQKMSGPNRFKLVLCARYLASQLDSSISATVSSAEMASSAGLPTGQVWARAKEAVDSKFAESVNSGAYRVLPHKIESFLDSLKHASAKKEG